MEIDSRLLENLAVAKSAIETAQAALRTAIDGCGCQMPSDAYWCLGRAHMRIASEMETVRQELAKGQDNGA